MGPWCFWWKLQRVCGNLALPLMFFKSGQEPSSRIHPHAHQQRLFLPGDRRSGWLRGSHGPMSPSGWRRHCGTLKRERVIVLTVPLPLREVGVLGQQQKASWEKSRLIREIQHVQSSKSNHRNHGDGGEKEGRREVGRDQVWFLKKRVSLLSADSGLCQMHLSSWRVGTRVESLIWWRSLCSRGRLGQETSPGHPPWNL